MWILSTAMHLYEAKCLDQDDIQQQIEILTKLSYQLQRLRAQWFFIHWKIVLKEWWEISTKIRWYKIWSTEYRNPKDLSIVPSPWKLSDIYIIISDQNNKEKEINFKNISRIEEYSLRSEWAERLIEQSLARLILLQEEEGSIEAS